MATLPAYAKILLDGYAEQRESALLRTDMESGPPKQAKIKSRVMVRRSVTIDLKSLADYQAFITWFSVTINEGADWFDYTDPVAGSLKSARFVGGGLTATPVGSTQTWRIQTQLESWGS